MTQKHQQNRRICKLCNGRGFFAYDDDTAAVSGGRLEFLERIISYISRSGADADAIKVDIRVKR
jgi:hypothetical protein